MIRRFVLLLLLAAVASACVAPTTVDGVVLEGTTWRASLVAGANPVLGREPTITFKAPGVSGSGGCNAYSSGHAEINGNAITITSLGLETAYCEPRESQLMRVEQQFFVGIAAATEIHIVDGHLELTTPDGALSFVLVSGPGESAR